MGGGVKAFATLRTDFHKVFWRLGDSSAKGKISKGTTANEVVKQVVIPETKNPARCYMDSEFMKKRGGGKRARKLVSHAWKSDFMNTVANIILEASGWNRERLTKASFVVRISPPCTKSTAG